MRKIFILEDRVQRKNQYLNDSTKGLMAKLEKSCSLHFSNQEENEKVKRGEFNILNDYSLLAFHRSALTPKLLDEIVKEFSRNKDIVFFSGGISQSVFSKNGDFSMAHINSKEFYSQSAVLFFEKYCKGLFEHFSEMVYGSKWKLNLMLVYRYKLISNNVDRIFEETLPDSIKSLNFEELTKEIHKELTML